MDAPTRERLILASDRDLVAEVEVHIYKASGTGGQKRNKTSNAVRMRHVESGVVSKSSDSRSQAENRARALVRFRENLALDVRCPLADDYEPSAAVTEALLRGPYGKNSKVRREGPYLLALAEVLDVFAHEKAVLSAAADRLGVTTGSLGKLLMGDERVARRAHELRSQNGLKPLR